MDLMYNFGSGCICSFIPGLIFNMFCLGLQLIMIKFQTGSSFNYPPGRCQCGFNSEKQGYLAQLSGRPAAVDEGGVDDAFAVSVAGSADVEPAKCRLRLCGLARRCQVNPVLDHHFESRLSPCVALQDKCSKTEETHSQMQSVWISISVLFDFLDAN